MKIQYSIADKAVINSVFTEYRPDIVVNLAAQAGVRYSIANPDAYIESNLIGFYNILEACRHSYHDKDSAKNGYNGVEHLVYASSSSVYGTSKKNDTFHTFHNIIYVCEITFTVSIIENSDCLMITKFICKSKICHIRPSRRTINCKEAKSR